MDELTFSKGPWRVDGDDEDQEYDIFDGEDNLIAEVIDAEDPGVTKTNAFLMASAWQMKEDIRAAIKLLRLCEDTQALKLLKATLQNCEPVQSGNEPRAADAGQAGGRDGQQRGSDGSGEDSGSPRPG